MQKCAHCAQVDAWQLVDPSKHDPLRRILSTPRTITSVGIRGFPVMSHVPTPSGFWGLFSCHDLVHSTKLKNKEKGTLNLSLNSSASLLLGSSNFSLSSSDFARIVSEWVILFLRFLGLFLPSGLTSSSSYISSEIIRDTDRALFQYDTTSNALSLRNYDTTAEEERRVMSCDWIPEKWSLG